MIPHRTPSISDASPSSAQEASQTAGPRRLLPAARPQPAESSTHYQTAPLTRKRAPIALACEACRQKKVKCNGARPVCSQCRARKSECIYRATADTDYRDKYEALLESHPAAVVYRAIQTRPRTEALEIVRRIQAGVDAETLMRQLSSADLLLQVQLEPETRSRYQFICSPLMPTYLQTDDNPFMRSLTHEWSTRDDIVSIASPVFTETDLGYKAQYLRPHHAATIVDSRLDEIVPSRWTTVNVSDDTMRELIRAYFLQEYDWFTFFHKDHFLDDMISGSSTFCSSLFVNAVLAVGCQCRNYVSEPAEYWNPNSLGYRFLEEARRLWIVEVTHNRTLTTLQAALVLNTIVNMFDMDPLSSAFLVRSIEIAYELGLFEPTTYIMNKKLRNSYDLTAWSLFHWQWTSLPDPDRDPDWFGEIWLKYPSSSTLVPLRIGLVFKAKMSFSVVLNEAMLEVQKDSSDSYLFQNGEPLSPTKIVSPSQLKLHLHYCYIIIQLYEILAPAGQRQSPNLPIEEEELQKTLSKYRGYFETILRIHYLRHSFEYGNMMLTRFLAMLVFLSLKKIESLTKSTEPGHVMTGSGLDVGDTDPKEARATLLIAQKGLSDQGRGYYLPKTLLRDVLANMTASDATILQSFITIPPEGPEKTQERKMYMESHCPPDILHIANDPTDLSRGFKGFEALALSSYISIIISYSHETICMPSCSSAPLDAEGVATFFDASGRITWMTFMIVYFLYFVDCWYGALFTGGMLICDVHLLTSADAFRRKYQEIGSLRYWQWTVVIMGLYLGGVPHVPSTRLLARNPGWALLSCLKPEIMADPKWIYLFWSGTLIVSVVTYVPMVKKILRSRISQELGRISYGLYLIHGPVMWTVGAAIYSWSGCCRAGNSGQDTRQPILGLELEFVPPHAILLPLTLGLARLVDAPSIRLAKWFYERSLHKEPDSIC
ncbi:nitrate assimilation regulatory nirA [Fusarium agapanthi]|uniref:Nitrate assimilation regulatory nirA n=1 Tax=Fusarium agapanthi TaxID=1803897 RepID=A0A9P5EA37_9HYPO|nr:nitrate assimilation regulatory nirA [Fusarium agapanthi]